MSTTNVVEKICWSCCYWACPDWFDVESHRGRSGCTGVCRAHCKRTEADDTCQNWSKIGVKPTNADTQP